MKFASHVPQHISHLQSKYFTAKLFHSPQANFTEKAHHVYKNFSLT